MRTEVNVERLNKRFAYMAANSSLLVNSSQEELLTQIIGTVVREAMDDTIYDTIEHSKMSRQDVLTMIERTLGLDDNIIVTGNTSIM